MSQISVVHFNPMSKTNVLQQNNVNNKQTDRQIIVLRKPQTILPQPKDDILITNTTRKKPKTTKEVKTNPQPIAVARRNARERNRVKQVNNGFATLRQHIPNFIAATFESNSGRGGNKKLSKVETLRMAVEYIRSLEDILAMEVDGNDATGNVSDLSYPSPSSSTSSMQNLQAYSYQTLSPPAEEDDLLSTSATPPLQFIRLNSSTSYQILPTHLYENGENLDPLVEDNMLDPSLLDPNLEFNQDLSYLNSMHTTSSLSPGMYSDTSLSPGSLERSEQCFIPVFNNPTEERLTPSFSVQVKSENSDLPVISLKTENEIPDEHKENIVDVLQWWEEQPQHTGS